MTQAKTVQEQHIAQLIIELHNTHRVCLRNESTTFTATTGVSQGDPLAPTLFNFYLEDCSQEIPTLKEAI